VNICNQFVYFYWYSHVAPFLVTRWLKLGMAPSMLMQASGRRA